MITQDDVLYMIVTDRFADGDPANNGDIERSALEKRHGGDLMGIIQRLPYLQELGVTALWITPVYLNPPDAYHGYHPLDFETVDPHLCSPELGPSGSREVVRKFVQIAHDHGLKVLFDAVINHTALDHPWLKEHPDWYNPPSAGKWWLWGLPDLNHDNVDVNDYFTRNVLDWIVSTNVDGVRIDAARHVETGFWDMFKVFAHGLRPDVTLIGEVWDGDVAQVAPYQAYHGFDSMFDFPLYYAIVDVFAGDQGFGRLARPELSDHEPWGVLNHDTAYRDAYDLITFLGNQDTPRFYHLAGGAGEPRLGREADSGGGRSPGRRDEAITRTRLALTFLFTTRGVPQLYYGDELAMEGGLHPDNRRDMPWALIDEAAASAPEAIQSQELRCFTHRLITLRRSSTALRFGLLTTLYLTPTLYSFARASLDETRVVVLNNGWEAANVTIPIHANPRLPIPAREYLHNGLSLVDDLNPGETVQIVDGSIRVRLPAKTGAVYRRPSDSR